MRKVWSSGDLSMRERIIVVLIMLAVITVFLIIGASVSMKI